MADYNKKFLNNKFKNKHDKEKLINNIIKDFQDYQNTLNELKSTRKEVDAIKKAKIVQVQKDDTLSLENLLLEDKNYTEKKAILYEQEQLYKKIKLNYKIALIQRKNIYNNVDLNIREYKKMKAIMVLKSQYIGSIINRVQISIIFVSSTITLFESIKSNFIIPGFYLTLIPIILSTYIAIILAISRFYKFDTKKENIKKVEEKFSYIINRLRYKRRKVTNFDFACEKLTDWKILIENFNKDGLEEMITKTIEESDSLLTLKEYTYYHKIYNKIKTKSSLHHFNSQLIDEWKDLNSIAGKHPRFHTHFQINNTTELNNNKTNNEIPHINKKRCVCFKICRIFNCCKTTLIDYDVFFSYLERNHELKVLDEFEHEEDDEEDYDDYDIEDGIHTGKEKTPSPKRDFGGYSSRRRKIFHRSKTKIEEDEEKIINDMDNLELQVDISGNSSSMLALVPPKIRKRSSSTHTDYESDQEY